MKTKFYQWFIQADPRIQNLIKDLCRRMGLTHKLNNVLILGRKADRNKP